MTPTALPLDLLDLEWATLAHSPTTQTWFEAWRDEAAPAVPCGTAQELVTFFENRRRPRTHDDTVFRGLAVRASTGDSMAARMVVQLLMPGWRSLARRYAWLQSPEEIQALVVAIAYERISSYPALRRPGGVAANILGDTQQWLLRRLPDLDREVLTPRPPDVPPPWSPPEEEPAAGEELLALLCAAVEDGLITRENATLIARTRFGSCTIRELARREGVDPDTVRHRRQRAELRLRALAA